MQDPLERLKAANADLERRDNRLREELAERRESVRAREGGGRGDAGESALEGRAVDRVTLAQETIVRRTGRPVLAIRRSQAQLVFEDPDSVVWKARLERAASRLARAASAVGRIEVDGHALSWVGTGWLVSPDTIVTNRHVASEFARRRGRDFVYRPALSGGVMSASIDFIEEIERSDSLVFRLERVLHIEEEGGPDVAFLRVAPAVGQVLAQPIALASSPAEQDAMVAVIGYPARDSRIPDVELMERIFGNVYDKKRLAPGQITVASRRSVEHDCSTLGGNSGSVVLSLDTGEAVAIHFAGRFLAANFAVPAAIIAERLEHIGRPGGLPRPPAPPPREDSDAPVVRQTVSAPTAPAASFAFTVPIHLTVQVGDPRVGAVPGALGAPPAARPLPVQADEGEEEGEDEEFAETEAVPEDYRDRVGYVGTFLGGGDADASLEVPLPEIARNASDVLEFTFDGRPETVLHYEHFSVVMSRSRRLCLFSAVNIDGGASKRKRRVGWRTDPRIARTAQIRNECYGNAPRFARGHMTRREDPVWGSDREAATGNADSMHVTNAVPQIQPFNAGIWLGLEDFALDHAREDDMRITVFTGPFLTTDDPIHFGVQIPVRFWKVIAFVHDDTGELCATGYTMSQKPFLREEEFVFGQHETAQASIAAIESETGLSFGRLAALDPFEGEEEAVARPLRDFRQIRFVKR